MPSFEIASPGCLSLTLPKNTGSVAPALCASSEMRSSKGWSQPHERQIRTTVNHRHHCDFAGHNWQCNAACECICGLPVEGSDHSKCPVELRACPEHSAEQERSIAEAMASEPDPAFVQRWHERPDANAGAPKPSEARSSAGAS